MKHNTMLSVIIVATILCFAGPVAAYIYKDSEYEALPAFDPIIMSAEEAAIYEKALAQYDGVIINDRLMAAFAEKYGNDGGWPKRYPDNFAGTYLDENGQLVIQVRSNESEEALDFENLHAEYASYIDIAKIREQDDGFKANKFSDVVTYEQAKYSYNELMAMTPCAKNIVAKDIPVSDSHIDTFNNCIVIQIDPLAYKDAADMDNAINAYVSHKYPYHSPKIPFIIKAGVVICTY